MLKLLSCPLGHYWEKPAEDEADGICPVCGQAAEAMPLLDLAPSEAVPPTTAPPPPPPLQDKDGWPIVTGYEILEDLGKGPTGIHLYRARQLLVNRIVALKVVFAKDDPSQFAWGGLRGEAVALGRLAHPNIVQILDAGERERQLFYNAVEHIDGPTLAEAVSNKPLPLHQAIALVETLARAVHHAHEKNVLHRNLKPASILLAMQNAECGMQNERQGLSAFCIPHSAFCIPKITDFGLARRPIEGDAADVELQGGLPCYLSPEQAWGRTKDIGPATDVYALGAILYELIAGRPPFRGETEAQTLDAIQCREPAPLRRWRSRVPDDLDAICRKCLAKQPRRRYASALELAEDLRRCASGYPVKARIASGPERLGRWLRRNFRNVVLVLLALWAGISLFALFSTNRDIPSTKSQSLDEYHRLLVARLEADLRQTRRRADAADYFRYLDLAKQALAANEPKRVREFLERCPFELRRWEWWYLHSRLKNVLGSTTYGSSMSIISVDLSSDGRYLALGAGEEAMDKPREAQGEITVYDLSGRKKCWQERMAVPVRAVAFSPGSSSLALVCSSTKRPEACEVQIRDAVAGRFFFRRPYPQSQLTALAYSSDGTHLLLAGGDGIVRVLRANDRHEIAAQPVAFRQVWPRGGRHCRLVPLDPEGNSLALISPDGGQIVALQDGQTVVPLGPQTLDRATTYYAIAYNAQHKTLATGASDQTVQIWSAFPLQRIRTLNGHKGAVTGVAFSSDGERLATCGADGTVRIWDTEQEVELLILKDYPGAVGVRFGPSVDQKIINEFNNLGGEWPSAQQLVILHGNKVSLLQPQVLEVRVR